MSDLERTLVLLKPDAVQRGLVGPIISRYEANGLQLLAMQLRQIDKEMAAAHYAEHTERAYYPELEAFITEGPLVSMVWEGPQAIEVVRTINGETDGVEATPGTIRGDFSLSKNRNLVHASDAADTAAKEIKLWFPELA